MRVGGIFLLAFIVFHLLHFTTGSIHPGYTFSHTDVYGNVVSSFQVPWVSLLYIVAMYSAGVTEGLMWRAIDASGRRRGTRMAEPSQASCRSPLPRWHVLVDLDGTLGPDQV